MEPTKPPESFTLYKSSANNLPLEDESIQMVITSPPYFGLRTYHGCQDVEWADGSKCPFGNEKTVKEYVEHTIEVLQEIKRVLKDNGVVFWNVGDSCDKTKSLCLIPQRIAIAAQDGGWIVRSVIIWQKPNATPESCKDRPTSSYEPIIMLTKQKKYYWNVKGATEPSVCFEKGQTTAPRMVYQHTNKQQVAVHTGKAIVIKKTRNLRNV